MPGPAQTAETARAYRTRLAKRFVADEAAEGDIRAEVLRGELSVATAAISLAQPRETAGFGDLVLTIQRRLATLGFYTGIVDGIIGPASRGAIRAFQTAAGLKINERASNSLLAALDTAVQAKEQQP